MSFRYRAVGLVIISAFCGCSTFDCGSWWGRNSDGSSNLARNKPQPYQPGPIAGTYSNTGAPTAGTTIVQPPQAAPVKPPVVISSPVQTAPTPTDTTIPSLTPPPAPTQNQSGVIPSQYPSAPPAVDTSRVPGGATVGSFMSPLQMPDNQPSIPAPVNPGPQVKGPALDLTLPGRTMNQTVPPGSTTPMPLVLMPPANQPVQVQPPVVDMLPIASPVIDAPLQIAPPRIGGVGKPAVVNPGSVPPPLMPPPSVPQLDLK